MNKRREELLIWLADGPDIEEIADKWLCEVAQLKAGNARLQEALLDVINQACQVDITEEQYCVVSDLALSAYEDAIDLLEELGLVKCIPGKLLQIKWDTIGGKE